MEGLNTIKGRDGCFENITSLELMNIPNIQELELSSPFQDLREKPILVNISRFAELNKLKPFLTSTGDVYSVRDFKCLPLTTTSIKVLKCDDFKEEILDFSCFYELETLIISNDCFSYPSKIEICGLKKLKRIQIGDNCFGADDQNTELHIEDCERLKTIQIGNNSFTLFAKLSLSRLPQLETLELGSNCFTKANLSIVGMESLKMIQLGAKSFEWFSEAKIESRKENWE